MNETTSISAKVKARRVELGLSVHELARKAGISYRTIYRIEGEGRTPQMATARALARALRVRVGDLLRVAS